MKKCNKNIDCDNKMLDIEYSFFHHARGNVIQTHIEYMQTIQRLKLCEEKSLK